MDKKEFSDIAKDKKRKNCKYEETDDDNYTTDDDLDQNDITQATKNRRESIPVAPITINVSAYNHVDSTKTTRKNLQNHINEDISTLNENSNRYASNNEHEATIHKIRMQIDKRLLEILKLPLKDFVMKPVSTIRIQITESYIKKHSKHYINEFFFGNNT